MKSSSGYEIYHNTLSSCLNELENLVESKGYQVGDYFPLVNHVAYGQTERTQLEMIKNGKVANTLAIQIYRMESGRYELNCYPVKKFSKGGTILWAVKKGDPDYLEQIITENEEQIENAKKWAIENGFDRLRIAKINLSTPPDFKKTFSTGGGVKSYYIVTFGFEGDDGEYELHDSKPIFAENEEEAGELLRDQFWSYEGIRPDIQQINKAYKTGGSIKPLKFKIETDEFNGTDYLEIYLGNKGVVLLQKTKNKISNLFSSASEYKKLGIKPEDKVAFIQYLEVYKGFKGKGYAKLLMKKAIEIAQEKGWMPLYILAQPNSDNSQDLNLNDLTKFYESLGFKSLVKTKSNNIMILQKPYSKFEIGGSTDEGIDLFEDYENIPPQVMEILNKYEESFEDGDYKGLEQAHDELLEIGYTFEAYLDGVAYDLRPVGTKGKVSEEYATGGGVGSIKIGNKYLYKFDNKIWEVVGIEEHLIHLHNTQGMWWDNRKVTISLMKKWIKNRSMVKAMATGGGIETYKDLSKETPLVINDSSAKIGQVPEIDLIKTGKVIDAPAIRNSKDCYEIFKKFWNENNIQIVEQMNVLFLSKANKPLGIYQHSKGGIDGTTIDIEIISAMAVKSLAKGVIIAHNHPSGALVPSEADKQMTKKLINALKLFDISLLDSLIVTTEGYFSLADNGLMS